MKKTLSLSILACSLSFLHGCGAATSTPPPALLVATHFSVTAASSTLTAGTSFNITVSSLDASNALVSTYAGTVHFASSDPQAILPPNSPLASGKGTFPVTLKTALGQTITVTDTSGGLTPGTSSPITVTPSAASQFSVSVPASASAGKPFNFTVTAEDQFSNTVTAYSGAAQFTSTDSQAVFSINPAQISNGTATLQATLKTAGSQTITATDIVTPSITGASKTINTMGPLAIASGAPPSGTVGVQYGPSSIEYFKCTRTPPPGTSFVCVQCDPAACSSLPPCVGRGVRTTPSPCLSKRQVFLGFPLTAAGGTPPYTWSWSPAANSSLPVGLNVTNGKIVGGPQGPTSPGSFSVVVTVTDAASPATQASATYTMVVAPPPPLTITSSAPPGGTLGAPYNGSTSRFSLTASGGLKPYVWNWVAAAGSTLPPGLNLSSDGTMSGTPSTTSAGTYKVIVTVADSETPAMQTNANYTIAIVVPPPPTISTSPAPAIGTLNVAYVGYSFTAVDGLPPFTWTETGALPPGIMPLSPSGMLSGTPTAAGTFPITVQVQDALGRNSSPQNFNMQVFAKGFTLTGSMPAARELQMTTLLGDGRVLVAGGVADASTFFTQALLYDPAKGTFAPTTGSMTAFRVSGDAVLLKSGKVLLVGGKGANTDLATAELFNPATQTFTATAGVMETARAYSTATLLNDGTVLVTGGLDIDGNSTATAELFDPNVGMFSPVGNMESARFLHAATLLPTGKVLVMGGLNSGDAMDSAELYDPVSKTFTPTGNMTLARAGHTVTSLNSGKVLVTGGASAFAGAAMSNAELFDPVAGIFTATGNMATARSLHSATLRADGTVLVAGGDSYFYNGVSGHSLSAAELFDPVTGSFAAVADMTSPRESHTATLLNTGDVLVVGGSNGTLGYSTTTTVSATAELYQ